MFPNVVDYSLKSSKNSPLEHTKSWVFLPIHTKSQKYTDSQKLFCLTHGKISQFFMLCNTGNKIWAVVYTLSNKTLKKHGFVNLGTNWFQNRAIQRTYDRQFGQVCRVLTSFCFCFIAARKWFRRRKIPHPGAEFSLRPNVSPIFDISGFLAQQIPFFHTHVRAMIPTHIRPVHTKKVRRKRGMKKEMPWKQ